ncbi:SusC/RagA family TonB-linked outer membrane protein [Pedobacter frigoris]|uniref:SusC/RagA family TonB-linked outer membrane protein n=1 Tax=Pedobacter frigoris TaxID=2571272 RepID=A0A4U1CTB7_9SPHI|nr:SusC/RagA family TonB-linked outer membrane protein [Pedobacter frigoris]TKC08978.1 SusC/RagA family TonB-linked outer membrane protein [Pedobacter frigoris]
MNIYAFNNAIGVLPRWLRQTLLVMKITTLILLTALLQVSAASFGQKVTIVKNNIALSEVFKEIRKQTGYNVLWQPAQVNGTKTINLQIKNQNLDDALEQILSSQGLEYSIEEETVMIKPKAPSFLDRVVGVFADINVVGVVVDGETGNALAGASVKVKGGNRTTTTASNGAFYLQGVDEDATIEISFIGFKSVELKAAKNLGTIKLEVSFSDLNEVEINKGYYTEKRRLSTGSVGRVTADEISRQPVSNPLAALYGRVPGLVITQVTGVPGGNFNIEIRGQNSLRKLTDNNGNIPLYIIDGVPFSSTPLNTAASQTMYPLGVNGTGSGVTGASPFNSINPSDIESIEILKDADATAIYGSRGANGVVLITTKRGKTGQMQIDANVYSGVGKVTRKLDLLNTEEYLEMRREAFKNDGINALPANAYDLNGTWDQHKYTDWQKELIGGTAKNTDAQISFSGGTANSQYRFGGGYHKESTVFPGDFADQRASSSLSLSNTSPNQKFKSQITVNYSIGTTNLFVEDLTSKAINLAPNAPDLLDGDGNLNWAAGVSQNLLRSTKNPYDARFINLIANGNFGYQFIPGLILKATMGYTNAMRKEVSKDKISTYLPSIQEFIQNSSIYGSSLINSWIIEPQLIWSKQFQKNKINALIGGTFQDQNSESLSQYASGFGSEALMDNISAALNVSNNYSTAKYRYNAIYTRINYDYNNKYIINLTGRRDGSSRFGPNRQFANFGAIGVAWIFSEEKLIKNSLSTLSYGKIRGSYGITGSDQTRDYAFLDSYNPSTGKYGGLQGLGPTQLYNPDFGWEVNKKLEMALELGFFKERILLTTAWYRNLSSSQLVGYPLPPSTGFTSLPSYNLDATVQNTGFELELNTINIKTQTFSWTSAINFSIPKNKLVSYPNLAGSSYASSYVVGEPLAIVKLYRYIGVNPQTGLYEVQDVDNNNLYNAADFHAVFMGAKFNGGFNNSLKWKWIQLDFLLQFSKQLGRNYLSLFVNSPGYMQNQPKEILSNRWRGLGDLASIQKFTQTSNTTYNRYNRSDALYSDASFIRLKNLSLAYQLPKVIVDMAKIKAARIYIQGQNLLTITKYKGLDPETQAGTLPPLFFLTGGVQLTF